MNHKPDRGSISKIVVVAAFAYLCAAVACERDMRIALTNDSNPPSFKLSGSGRLFFFSVSEVSPGKPSSINDAAMWEVRPTAEDRISKLTEITYGVVPPGFSQTAPKIGTPPPLLEGKFYEAGGPGLEANGGSIRFTIKGGKAVVVSSEH